MTHSYVRHNSGGEQVALRYHSRHFVRTGAVCCMLQCVAQFCAVLHNVAQYCTLLQCFAYVAVCCSVLQFVADTIRATDCGRLQCVAVCYSLLWCVAQCYNVLQCVAVCCSVLQCVAVCCIVLQRVAVCCFAFQSVTVSLPPLSFSLFLTICLSLSHTHAYRRK